MLGTEQVPILIVAGAAAFSLSAMLWAMRVSEGSRGQVKRLKDRVGMLEEHLARSDSVFSAHPGVVFVYDAAGFVAGDELAGPSVYGSPRSFSSMLAFTDGGGEIDPVESILEGLADLEARDGSGKNTTLRQRMKELRQDGTPFSLTIIGPSGRFIEADGRTAGSRVVLWVTDTTVKWLEESAARGKLEEINRTVSRDPAAFLQMLDLAPFAAWRVSSSGKIEWANQRYLEAVEAPTLDHVLDRQLLLDQYVGQQAKRTIDERRDIDETRHMALEGERRSMRILTFPLSGGAAGMAFDVTKEEAARKALDRHVKAHDETLNHVADGVAIFGPDRKLVFHNRAFAEMWQMEDGFLLDEPTHSEILDRMREKRMIPMRSDYARWRAEELGYYQKMSNETAEEIWNLPDQRTIRVTRQRHPHGGLLILFKDITIETRLKTRFNTLIKTQSVTLDNLREAVVVFGGDGRLQLHNRAFSRLWEVDEAHLKDNPDFGDVVAKCLPLFSDRAVWDTIQGRVTNPSPDVRQETRGEMRRTDETVVKFITQPLPDGATLVAFVDESASRRVEEALRERAEAFQAADRLKTEFVQNVSYQLRSPLTTIVGYAEFLQSERNGELSDRQHDFVDSILTASGDLAKLIENILDLAMIEAGRMDLEVSDVNVAGIIEDSVEMVVSKAADTQVTVKSEVAEDIGLIRADERRVRQIVFNLVSNALRFTDPGDSVTIRADKEGEMVRITVEDTGRGIEFENQAIAFDTFQSGDQRGAGLGLALVRSFVELHGGWVGIQSVPDEGTSVVCVLPSQALEADLIPPVLDAA